MPFSDLKNLQVYILQGQSDKGQAIAGISKNIYILKEKC